MSSSTFEVSNDDEKLTYHKSNLKSHSRKFIRFDEECDVDAGVEQQNTTTTTTDEISSSTTTTTPLSFINSLSSSNNNDNTDKQQKQQQQQQLIQYIQESIIGDNEIFKSPFGYRKVTYCDYVASGRSLSFIEEYIQSQVLTLYANTHTTTSITGHQSTLFRYESRQLLMNAMNASKKDVLIFTGSGATSASNKLVHLLGLFKNQNINNNNNNNNTKNDSSDSSDSNDTDTPVVFVGPFEHHSNLLPWRESNAKIVTIRESPDNNGLIDLSHLRSELVKHSANSNKRLMIGAFSAASNITGVLQDTDTITALLHVYGAYAVWDYACAAPYVKIDMNVNKQIYGVSTHKDAIFFSPHKFVGGPGTPGVLLVKKHMFLNVNHPTQPGGDTVFFVTEQDHRYLKKPHEREEGGTPDVVGAVRAGLCFQLKSAVGEETIESLENELYKRAFDSFSQNQNIILLGHDHGTAATQSTDASLKRLPIFSFLVKLSDHYLLHYNFVSTLLNDLFGVQSRGGCACAGPYSLKLLGIPYDMAKKIEDALLKDDDHEFLRPGFTRINFNYFFNKETTDYVIEAVNWVATHGYKLMPYYTFYPDTGEWKHNLNRKTANNRRWIHNVHYSNGSMQYRIQVNQRIPIAKYKKEYEKYMKDANDILDAALDEFEANSKFRHRESKSSREDTPYRGGGYQVPDQKGLLSNHYEVDQLRWFVYPSEVIHYLREGHVLKHDQIFDKPCPWLVVQSSSHAIASTTLSSHTNKQQLSNIETMQVAEEETSSSTDIYKQEASSTAQSSDETTTLMHGDDEGDALLGIGAALHDSDDEDEEQKEARRRASMWPKIPIKKIMAPVKRAVMEFGMIKDGDRLLLGLSGGKDSLTLLHVLHSLQTSSRLPFNFEFGACTVDPQTDAYDPTPLINYCKQLGVPYYFESQNIIETAMTCQASSICSWCSRMKRGILYNVARRHGYNVLVLGQHLDDCAESFIMSILHNGYLRTMKAHYTIDEGDLRVIRPLTYVREKELKMFAREHLLPVINENCPACFEMPKERARVKTLLSNQEHLFPDLYHSLETAMRPLMDNTLDKIVGADHKKYKSNTKNKWPVQNTSNGGDGNNNNTNDGTPGPSVTSNNVRGRKSISKKRTRWANISSVSSDQQAGNTATTTTDANVNDLLANIDTSALERELERRRALQQQTQQQ